MSSSNPFRKKGSNASDRPPVVTDLPATSLSGEALHGDDLSADPPAGAVDKKTKPVKKVRVLSPPPLSPDSPEWPYNAALPALAGDNVVHSAAPVASDPFNGGASGLDSDRDSSTATPPPPQFQTQPTQLGELSRQLQAQNAPLPQGAGHTLPPNPFSKTLHDLENARKDDVLEQERKDEGAALKASNTARKSLNVDSFQRLLMTGTAESTMSKDDSFIQDDVIASQTTASDFTPSTASDEEDDNLRKAQSLPTKLNVSQRPRDNTGDNGEASDSDSSTNVQIGSKGKKAPPPPPSSRHGRSLTIDIKNDVPVRPAPLQRTPSDLNKALPPPPDSSHGDSESPFDREAAGKLPEWEPFQSPPPATNNGAKKAVPAPPPRRGHARSESKSHPPTIAALVAQSIHKVSADEPSSVTPSRSSSVRHSMPAPIPPPPRRPHTGSRQISTSSPTTSSFTISPLASPPASHPDMQSYALPTDVADSLRDLPSPGNVKLSAPPPPPKRNTSVRRPQSIQSVDALSRRIPRSDGTVPPPPPPRARGSSRSSLDGPPRRSSIDSFVKFQPSLTDTPRSTAMDIDEENLPVDSGKALDILADLTALQREVDALRGKLT